MHSEFDWSLTLIDENVYAVKALDSRFGLSAAHCATGAQGLGDNSVVMGYRGLVNRCKLTLVEGDDYFERKDVIETFAQPTYRGGDDWFEKAGKNRQINIFFCTIIQQLN